MCIWNTLTHLSQRVARVWPLITNIEKTGVCLCILYHAKEKINRYCWKLETKVLCFIPTGGWTLPLPVVVMNASSLWLPGEEGRGGCFYTGFSVPFVPLENPEILKRAQKGEPGVLATERDPSVVQQGGRATNELLLLLQQMSWLIATGNLCLFSFSLQIANSKRAPLTWSWQKL